MDPKSASASAKGWLVLVFLGRTDCDKARGLRNREMHRAEGAELKSGSQDPKEEPPTRRG